MRNILPDKIRNRKAKIYYTGLGLNRLSDNSKSCGKGGILGLYIEKGGIFLLLAVIAGQPVKSEV